MYFVSKVLSDSKTRYPQIEKLLYGILITKRKLRHYFDSHQVFQPSCLLGRIRLSRLSVAYMTTEAESDVELLAG